MQHVPTHPTDTQATQHTKRQPSTVGAVTVPSLQPDTTSIWVSWDTDYYSLKPYTRATSMLADDWLSAYGRFADTAHLSFRIASVPEKWIFADAITWK